MSHPPGLPGREWRGVIVATSLPFARTSAGELEPDLVAYAESVAWLADQGLHGVAPNGSLGEYQTLETSARDAVVRTAVEHATEGFVVMPGVGAYSGRESRRHAEVARDLGCQAVMALPPNAYRGDERAVLEHYELVAAAGLPVVAYNNPVDTKIDLTAPMLARLHREGLIVAVKEFTGDPRRAYEIAELAPGLDVLIGSDDTVLEVALAGGVGWVSGYAQVFPRACLRLFEAAVAGDLDTALPLYRTLHPLLRWDSRTEFVQAIKLGQDLVGRSGGVCRPPRQPLDEQTLGVVRAATLAVIDAGLC